jgi:hypothetical protein
MSFLISNPCASEFTKKFNLVFIETIQWLEDIHLRKFSIETELNEMHCLLNFRHPVEKQTNEPWSSAMRKNAKKC